MPIIAAEGGGGEYTNHPEGVFAAVCADIADLGMKPNTFDTSKPDQHKIRIYWYAGKTKNDGTPLLASRMFTLSLHDKAA